MSPEQQPEDRPYEETLHAARVFKEIARSAGDKPAPSDVGKTDSRPSGPTVPTNQPEKTESGTLPPGKEKPSEPSIGELFSKLVKTSPPGKIRIEEGSIGSLFKKYIGPPRTGKRGTGPTS